MKQFLGAAILLTIVLVRIYGSEFQFSDQYVGVLFNPLVSLHDQFLLDVYNQTEIMSMMDKISTRFRRILMNSISPEDVERVANFSAAKIPVGVATLNNWRRLNKSQPPLELLMLFKYTRPTHHDTKTSFQFVKEKADEANELFPGTVKHLIFDLLNTNWSAPHMLENVKKYLTSAKLQLINSSSPYSTADYKLGALLEKEFCEPTQSPWNISLEIFPYLNTIMFRKGALSKDLPGGPNPLFLNRFKAFFESCKSKVMAEFGDVVEEVSFQTSWPDSDGNGTVSSANLVLFWESIGKWAERSQTTVVFRDAFDVPSVRPAPFFTTMGWWRLVESSYYTSALDYVFEEKKYAGDQPSWNDSDHTEWLGTYFPDDTASQPPGLQRHGANFIGSSLFIELNPYVSKADVGVGANNTYSEGQLSPLINLVSKEFTNFFIETMPPYDSDYNVLNVPLAIAHRNVNGSRRSAPIQNPCQITMVFRCQKCFKRHENESLPTEFDSMKRVADQANRIFPGTVQTLLTKYENLKSNTVRYLIRDLNISREKIMAGPSPSSFTLGALLPIFDCGTTSSRYILKNNTLLPLLDHVDILVFYIGPSVQNINSGVEASLGGFFRQFKFCREKIQRVRSDLEVGFMLSWSDTFYDQPGNPGVTRIGTLVRFWGRLKEWANETKIPVFINEAFDTPFRGSNEMSTRGWWRLIQNESYEDPSDYVFEDKKMVFLREIEKPLGVEPSTPSSGNDDDKSKTGMGVVAIFVSVGVASLSLLGFIGCGVALFYTKFLRKQEGPLTKDEIYEFFNGGGNSLAAESGMGDVPNNTAYKNELELTREEFVIVEDTILGSGEYGTVLLAKVRRGGGAEVDDIDVAAKTTKSFSSTGLKGILSEIRILGYLGHHENIVNIIGAYTAELYKGKVYIFTELCPLGSLENLLRKLKPTRPSDHRPLDYVLMANQSEHDGRQNGSCSQEDPHDISELVRWAYEICCGLEFIASKQVVHGDVATRNILLSAGRRTAKISDFGLSRRLYAYESYVKKNDEPLPWRWMSPESLRKLEFNEKSDVWSFGVTLWEIFSYGDVPYAGLIWSTDFVNRLENGLRLGKPNYDCSNLHPVMFQCWNVDGSLRPIFSELKARISKCLSDSVTKNEVENTAL